MHVSQMLAPSQVDQPELPLVLIVDDDASVRTSLSRLLRGAGYNVQAFSSTKRLFETGRPRGSCCLILDVEMPHVNGLKFHQELDRAGVRVPTIFITGYGNIPMGVDAMKAGAMDFLPKPFDIVHLVQSVRTRSMKTRDCSLKSARRPTCGGATTTSRRGSARCSSPSPAAC